MSENSKSLSIKSHYNAVAAAYHEQYDPERLTDLSRPYPANYFRLQKLLESFQANGVKRALEVGVGDGMPLAAVARLGIDVWGFDLAEKMVSKAKGVVEAGGGNPEQIFIGDIQTPKSYIDKLPDDGFDGVVANGVMPHIESEQTVLENITALLHPGGRVFIEFRNKLFSIFTFNRNTLEFIVDELLLNATSEMRERVRKDLTLKLRMDLPPIRDRVQGSDAPGYDAILSKFHNPFEMVELFKSIGYDDIELHWYHYHPAMPYLEQDSPKQFRDGAISMEYESSGWRGYFLASAFVVEAVKCPD